MFVTWKFCSLSRYEGEYQMITRVKRCAKLPWIATDKAYYFWKTRTCSNHCPTMLIFDIPFRENCTECIRYLSPLPKWEHKKLSFWIYVKRSLKKLGLLKIDKLCHSIRYSHASDRSEGVDCFYTYYYGIIVNKDEIMFSQKYNSREYRSGGWV